MREASTAGLAVGCNPLGVLGSPGRKEGLAMVDGEVLGGIEGEGQGERAGRDPVPSQRER